MKPDSSPLLPWGLALGLVVFNLLITVCTAKIDFFPSKLAYQCGFAFGTACAAFQIFAGRFANARFEQLPERTRDRMRRSLATRAVLILALIQFLVGIFAFARGVSGLYVWTFGEKATANYNITRVYWNSSRYKRCYNHDLAGLDGYSNAAFAPCLEIALREGSKIVFRGRKSLLGFKYYDFAGEIDLSPPPR